MQTVDMGEPTDSDALIHEVVESTLRCLGAGSQMRITYVVVPVKTGFREFALMRELDCSRNDLRLHHTARWHRDVLEPNLSEAQKYSREARRQYPGSLVFDPSQLGVGGTMTVNYLALSDLLLEQYAIRIVATPDWALSLGARHEIEKAHSLGRPIVDTFGKSLSTSDLEIADRDARRGLKERGWPDDLVASLLPVLEINRNRLAESIEEPVVLNASETVFRWLHEERQHQRRWYSEVDDDRTRLSFHDKSENSWWARLIKYWDQAEIRGADNRSGREHLAKFAAVAIGMLESIVRVHGELPEPAVPTTNDSSRLTPMSPRPPVDEGRPIDEVTAGAVGGTVFAWLQRERDEYVKPGTNPQLDTRHLEEGLGRGDFWYGQLFGRYWERGVNWGPETLAGRQQFAKFTSTAIALVETAVRVYGDLPPRKLGRDE